MGVENAQSGVEWIPPFIPLLLFRGTNAMCRIQSQSVAVTDLIPRTSDLKSQSHKHPIPCDFTQYSLNPLPPRLASSNASSQSSLLTATPVQVNQRLMVAEKSGSSSSGDPMHPKAIFPRPEQCPG